MLNAIVTITGALAIGGVYEYVKNPLITPLGHFLSLPFPWHTTTAGLLILLLPIVFIQFLYTEDIVKKCFFSFVFLLTCIALCLTLAHSAWVIAGIVLLVLTIINLPKVKRDIIWIGLIAIVFVLCTHPLFAQSVKSSPQLNAIVLTSQADSKQKLDIYKVALEMIKSRPILGSGPGTFYLYYEKFQDTPWLYASHAFNEYLENAADTGIIGGIIFIALILSIYFIANEKRSYIQTYAPSQALLGGVTAMVLYSLVEFSLRDYTIFVIFFILIALFFRSLTLKEDHNVALTEITKNHKIGLFILAGVSVLVSCYIFYSTNLYTKAIDEYNNKNVSQAQKDLTKSHQLLPLYTDPTLTLATLADFSNDYKTALQYTNNAQKYSTMDGEVYYRKAEYYYRLGDLRNALANVKLAIYDAPYANPQSFLIEGYIYRAQNNTKLAEKAFNAAIKKYFPLTPQYHQYKYIFDDNQESQALGSVYLMQSQIEHNTHYRDLAIQLNPIYGMFKQFLQ